MSKKNDSQKTVKLVSNSTRSYILPTVIILAILTLFLTQFNKPNAIASQEVSAKPTLSAVEDSSSPAAFTLEQAQPFYAKLDSIIAVARDGAKGETAAETMLERFAQNVVMAKMATYGKLISVPRNTVLKRDAVFATFITKQDLKLIPTPMESPFLFQSGANMVVCGDFEPISKKVLATLLLHELVHWDLFVKRGKTIDLNQFPEEVIAHELEFRAADRLTNGAFNKTIADTLREEALHTQSGWGTLWPTSAGWKHLHSAWKDPSMSQLETELRTTGAMVGMQFAQMKDEKSKERIYAKIRHQYSSGQDVRNIQ